MYLRIEFEDNRRWYYEVTKVGGNDEYVEIFAESCFYNNFSLVAEDVFKWKLQLGYVLRNCYPMAGEGTSYTRKFVSDIT